MAAVIVKFSKGKYINENALDNVIPYIMRLKNLKFIGGCGIVPISEDAVVEQFYKVKKAYGMMDGKQIIHMIVSVDKTLRFNVEHMKRLAEMMLKMFEMDRQVIYAVHDDTNHLHFHMGINTVGYHGNYCAFLDVDIVKEYAKKCVDVIVDELWFGNQLTNKS